MSDTMYKRHAYANNSYNHTDDGLFLPTHYKSLAFTFFPEVD